MRNRNFCDRNDNYVLCVKWKYKDDPELIWIRKGNTGTDNDVAKHRVRPGNFDFSPKLKITAK